MRPEIYWIGDALPLRLAIMPRPRGGDWLADELKALQSLCVGVIVSLLTDDENVDLDLKQESVLCGSIGLTYVCFPIQDRGLPISREDFLVLIERLRELLRENRAVVIHCRMGIGRSSVVAASLLMKAGFSVNQAFQSISRARGFEVPDTNAQRQWVASIATYLTIDQSDL